MSQADLAKQLGELQAALNIAWTLSCAFLVMFMQAGFALLETGLVRSKNVAHTMGMNLLVYALGVVGYWAFGFALQMGGVGAPPSFGSDASLAGEFTLTLGDTAFGLFGTEGFFLSPSTFTPAVAATFLFQVVFMDAAASIPTGAATERWRFSAFVAFTLCVSVFIYPLYANWVWGGGFLSALGRHFGLGHGHVDFAGGSVVHMTGGVMAFLVARALGPRIGKFAPSGAPRAISGHNLPMVVSGTFILAFGWFGFNAGSTLASSDTRIAIIAVNTMLASAAGAVTAYAVTKVRFGAPDVSMICNGLLAGLVAITAPCAFVAAPIAVAIGAVAGALVVFAALYVEQSLRIDDPVGAISVHAVSGTWGILALGLFADGRYGEGLNGVPGPVRGLFYGDPGQLVASLLGIAFNLLWVAGTTTLALRAIERTIGLRTSPADELDGLDVSEMGGPGYPSDPSAAESFAHEPSAGGAAPSGASHALGPTR